MQKMQLKSSKKKMELEQINNSVSFFEKEHKYFLKNKELTSTTTVLGFFKNQFDPDGHITRAVAKRDGITIDEVKENWNKIKIEGLERGKNFHRQAEHYIKTGEILKEDYKDVVSQLKNILPKPRENLHSEIGLHSPTYSIAGTCDVIFLDKDKTLTFDFKSNKKFTTVNKYKKFLLYPLEHLPETDYTIYSLQLGIYNLMLKEHGYKIKKGSTILWINHETRLIEKYPILDLQKECIDLLEHFKKINEF